MTHRRIAASALAGYWLSYTFDLTIGGSMATMTGAAFLLAYLLAPERGLVAQALRRARQRWEFAQQMLALVNAERAKAGCSPLTENAKLTKAAQDHSQDMADHQNMSHTGSDGSSMSDRLARVGYAFRTAGENVAYGYSSAESVMDGWMNSPGHKANILNCAFKEIGIGLARPGYYWTQDFGATS